MLLATPIEHYLIIGRPKGNPEACPWIAFETTNEQEALQKLTDLNKSSMTEEFKLQTWTKVR